MEHYLGHNDRQVYLLLTLMIPTRQAIHVTDNTLFYSIHNLRALLLYISQTKFLSKKSSFFWWQLMHNIYVSGH